jgi:hypothetical protein
VYSALAQSLIEATSVPADEVTPRFADLVLLVNPAIERARYLPIYDLAQVRTFAGRSSAQPPVFICATATNDWATGLALPIGNAKLTILLVTPVLRDTRSPLLLRACRIFPLEDTDEQNDQALLDARHSAKRVHGHAYRQVTGWFDAERWHPPLRRGSGSKAGKRAGVPRLSDGRPIPKSR